MARIKGVAIREFATYLRTSLGADEVREVVRRLPPRHASVFDADHASLGLLAASWYEIAPVHAFLDSVMHGRSAAQIDHIVRDGTQATLSSTLTGVHRALLRVVGSPSLHARFAQRLWAAYYDQGVVESTVEGPGRQRLRYTQWAAHHPLLCRLTSESDTVIFPAMGLTNVRISERQCISDGEPACGHIVTWDAPEEA